MNDAAPIGHNRPNELIAGDALEFRLASEYSELVDRARELVEKGERFCAVSSDEDDSASTEFLVKARACYKPAEAARQENKAPYDDAAGVVHAFFKTKILDPLTALGARVNKAQTDFKVAKANAERRRREEEARAAAAAEAARREEAAKAEREAQELARAAARKRNVEAQAAAEAQARAAQLRAEEARLAEQKAAEARAEADKAAAAPAADLSRARGERGGVSSLKAYLTFRDLDRRTLDLEMLRNFIPDKGLEQAVKGWIDANKGAAQAAAKGGAQPIKGAIIFEDLRSAGRA